MRVTEPYTIFPRTLSSGKIVYYYQFRNQEGKRSSAKSTGCTTLSAARRYCQKLYNDGEFKINSHILLYTLVYNKGLYTQSGLSWAEYSKASRERLGLEQRDITDQLSAARFFIVNHKELERQGFTPIGNYKKLARAELATSLCGNVHETIKHLINDTAAEYKEWYSSFKIKKLPESEIKREDVIIKDNKFYIGKVEAVKVSAKVPEQDRIRLEKYVTQIFDAIRKGYEPAIIQCYDEKEVKVMNKLRDKYRQGK